MAGGAIGETAGCCTNMDVKPDPAWHIRGFSLIEVAIVMVVVGILASIALSNYRSQILRDCRRDGWSSLEAIASLQELHYFHSHSYASSAGKLGAKVSSPNGHYKLETEWIGGDASTYRVIAKPMEGSSCLGSDEFSFRLSHSGRREHNDGEGWKPGWGGPD